MFVVSKKEYAIQSCDVTQLDCRHNPWLEQKQPCRSAKPVSSQASLCFCNSGHSLVKQTGHLASFHSDPRPIMSQNPSIRVSIMNIILFYKYYDWLLGYNFFIAMVMALLASPTTPPPGKLVNKALEGVRQGRPPALQAAPSQTTTCHHLLD